ANCIQACGVRETCQLKRSDLLTDAVDCCGNDAVLANRDFFRAFRDCDLRFHRISGRRLKRTIGADFKRSISRISGFTVWQFDLEETLASNYKVVVLTRRPKVAL